MRRPTNVEVLSRGHNTYLQKKSRKTLVAEPVVFDEAKRSEFINGFRKRKLARTAAKKEKAILRDREEHLAMKKEMRERRKRDLERQVQEMTAFYRQQTKSGDVARAEDEDAGEALGFENDKVEYNDDNQLTTVTLIDEDMDLGGLESLTRAGLESDEYQGMEDSETEKVDAEDVPLRYEPPRRPSVNKKTPYRRKRSERR